ncbi:MAG: ribonuclease HI family protein [Candidatus Kappaea frigidicola]|nr:ribonuclease HI family protein [Candidatus Kappaea frigidicola]
MELTVFTDGASQGNPGHAGAGIVIFDSNGKKIKEVSQYIGQASNNVAEYTALIIGLSEAASLKAKKVILKSDSELIVKQLNGQYKVKSDNIKALYFIASNLKKLFDHLTIKHIPRELNQDADSLASNAASRRA